MIYLSSAVPSAAQRPILLGLGCNTTLTAPPAVCPSCHSAADGNSLGEVLVRKILKERFILFCFLSVVTWWGLRWMNSPFFYEQYTEMSVHFILEQWNLDAEVAAVAGSGAAQLGCSGHVLPRWLCLARSGTAGWPCNTACSCSPACTSIPKNPTVFQLQIEFWHWDTLLFIWEGKSSVLHHPADPRAFPSLEVGI